MSCSGFQFVAKTWMQIFINAMKWQNLDTSFKEILTAK